MYATKEIKEYGKLPKVWENENGQILSNFNNSSKEVYNAEGFYDLVKPPITANQEYKKLKKSDFNDETFIATYRIKDLTEQEIDDKEEKDTNEEQNSKYVGSDYYIKVKRRLYRRFKKGKLTQNQFNKLYTPIRKALIWCNTGDFDIALEEVNKLSFTNQKLKNEIDRITEFLNEQIIEINYKGKKNDK